MVFYIYVLTLYRPNSQARSRGVFLSLFCRVGEELWRSKRFTYKNTSVQELSLFVLLLHMTFYCNIWHFHILTVIKFFMHISFHNFQCIFGHCFHFIFHLWIFNTELWLLWASTFFVFLRCCLPALLGETPNNHRVVICLFFSLNHCNKRSAFMGRSVQLHTWLLSRAYLCSLRYTIWVNSL